MNRSKSTESTLWLAVALTALVSTLAPGLVLGQVPGPTVVVAPLAEPEFVSFDIRRGACAGVVDAAMTELMLHCGHNFTAPVTLTLVRMRSGAEIARLEDQTSDMSVTVELTPQIRQDLRRGDIGVRIASADRTVIGELATPAFATGGSVRLEVDLLDADGVAGGACTALLVGIGTPFRLFDFYLDCTHELDDPVVAGLYDRNPASRLHTGTDGLLADLGDARSPVLLDWRIGDDGVTPVGVFLNGSLEIVVTGEDRELRAFLTGCLAGGDSVCLDKRFQVSSRYAEAVTGEGLLVPAEPWSFSSEAALFTFTDPDQVEVMVNLDDRCDETGFFALRASSVSEQRPRVIIIDTVTGERRAIDLFRGPRRAPSGPPNQPVSVIDPQAFPCE